MEIKNRGRLEGRVGRCLPYVYESEARGASKCKCGLSKRVDDVCFVLVSLFTLPTYDITVLFVGING